MNISIKSHRATKALCMFAIGYVDFPVSAIKLTTAYYNSEQ